MSVGDSTDTESPLPGAVKGSTRATTLVSELATALGMVRRTLPEAMGHIPTELTGVPSETWTELQQAYESKKHDALFQNSFDNGRSFATSEVALRHRQPGEVEWCGPRKLRGEGTIPADLRVDHVYLVSCKYDSRNFLNSGPAKLFDDRLRDGKQRSTSWYTEVARGSYQEYYRAVRQHFGLLSLPADVNSLSGADRQLLSTTLPRFMPPELADVQAQFCEAVSVASADRWRMSVGKSNPQRTEFAMTLLRIPQAVYFLLGQDGSVPHRFKVLSRWDWAKRFTLDDFVISSSKALQPTVDWCIVVKDRESGEELRARGHVEVRWSHGRFNNAPEAKVYLDSRLDETPGYVAL